MKDWAGKQRSPRRPQDSVVAASLRVKHSAFGAARRHLRRPTTYFCGLFPMKIAFFSEFSARYGVNGSCVCVSTGPNQGSRHSGRRVNSVSRGRSQGIHTGMGFKEKQGAGIWNALPV